MMKIMELMIIGLIVTVMMKIGSVIKNTYETILK